MQITTIEELENLLSASKIINIERKSDIQIVKMFHSELGYISTAQIEEVVLLSKNYSITAEEEARIAKANQLGINLDTEFRKLAEETGDTLSQEIDDFLQRII